MVITVARVLACAFEMFGDMFVGGNSHEGCEGMELVLRFIVRFGVLGV